MNIGTKFFPVAPTNQAAEWMVQDGDVVLGECYEVERQEGPTLFFFRNSAGVLVSVANFRETFTGERGV